MAKTADIIQRIAWRIPITVEDLTRFASELDSLVAQSLADGDSVELMTFGTFRLKDGDAEFTVHPALLKSGEEGHDDA